MNGERFDERAYDRSVLLGHWYGIQLCDGSKAVVVLIDDSPEHYTLLTIEGEFLYPARDRVVGWWLLRSNIGA